MSGRYSCKKPRKITPVWHKTMQKFKFLCLKIKFWPPTHQAPLLTLKVNVNSQRQQSMSTVPPPKHKYHAPPKKAVQVNSHRQQSPPKPAEAQILRVPPKAVQVNSQRQQSTSTVISSPFLAVIKFFAPRFTESSYFCNLFLKKMKKLLYFSLLVSLLSSCSNDFEVSAPWKEVPVVYGILSPRDTAHYIRIEKAFLDPNTSALDIAQIADSLYYPVDAINVWLERDSTKERFQLHRVDGNLEGYVREEGLFADQPNWLYKLDQSVVKPGNKYRLIIQRKDGKPDVTAETTVPKDFSILSPATESNFKPLPFFYYSDLDVDWRTDENGVYFNIIFVIPYREEAPDGTILKRDTLTWVAARNVERGNVLVSQNTYRGFKKIAGALFYDFLADNIEPTTTNFRYFEKGSIIVEGGGKEIKEYILSASANSGVTGAEVYPVYSNLSEGFGVFTAKNVYKFSPTLIKPVVVDSMNEYSRTQLLQFRY
jgi:hypothetical protein